MDKIRPLPDFLVDRYKDWSTAGYEDHQELYKDLVENGQHPRGMIISCCDSRVQMSSIFDAAPGDFFIHRNIANLVPPYDPDSTLHGTDAAIEYAVTALKVPHLIVVGHSQCGGVAGCHAMCSGEAPQLEEPTSFVGRWIETLRPGFERIDRDQSKDAQLRALEFQAVIVSLENLLSYPFVRAARDAGALELHGLWTDIGAGKLYQYDAETKQFSLV